MLDLRKVSRPPSCFSSLERITHWTYDLALLSHRLREGTLPPSSCREVIPPPVNRPLHPPTLARHPRRSTRQLQHSIPSLSTMYIHPLPRHIQCTVYCPLIPRLQLSPCRLSPLPSIQSFLYSALQRQSYIWLLVEIAVLASSGVGGLAVESGLVDFPLFFPLFSVLWFRFLLSNQLLVRPLIVT